MLTDCNKQKFTPRLIAWEITRKCNLKCRHCRASALNKNFTGELSVDEIKKTIDNISIQYTPLIILTGGDPLLYDGIYQIASYGTKKGFSMVLASCGYNLKDDDFIKMKDAGIKKISFSIDGKNAESHDDFRGVDGSFSSIMESIQLAQKHKMPFQINTTITKHNLHELPGILNLAVKKKAYAFHPFLLVPTGRAKEMINMELSPGEYEKTLNWIYEQKDKTSIEFKPTCAPHYYRILRQQENKKGITINPETHGRDANAKGCIGGQAFAFISHTGTVQVCGFLDIKCGDLRKSNYDFNKIWESSDVFLNIRNKKNYKGKCGICEYYNYCGGCRARAYTIKGDYLDEEPFCNYEPGKEIKNSYE